VWAVRPCGRPDRGIYRCGGWLGRHCPAWNAAGDASLHILRFNDLLPTYLHKELYDHNNVLSQKKAKFFEILIRGIFFWLMAV
jgi:hypothetical protein